MICEGCDYANKKREVAESLQQTCLFCRHPLPATEEEVFKLLMRRVEANDPLSLVEVGAKHYSEGDYASAFKYWTNAAESGDAEAHYQLSVLYQLGNGVQTDLKKELYHLEIAAIAGHPIGRYNLGCAEFDDGSIERAMKHYMIAANLGHNGAIQMLKEGFQSGEVSKEDFATALRGHQAAVDATKSPQRSEAAKQEQK